MGDDRVAELGPEQLVALLRAVNEARSLPDGRSERTSALRRAGELLDLEGGTVSGDAVEAAVQARLGQPDRRLAVYGSLAPGEINDWVLADIAGRWESGVVRGSLERVGWGEACGYPGLTWQPGGDPVPVRMLVSPQLPDHWDRIDRFEGSDYRRILVSVEREDRRPVVANLYAVKW